MANITPLCPLPFKGFTISLPDADTVVEADPAPYNNTKEIVVLNLGAAAILMRILDLGTPPTLPVGAVDSANAIAYANSTVIPAGASFSLCIGTEGNRNAISTAAGWAANGPGSQFVLAFRLAEAGDAVRVNITYVQAVGGFSL